MVSLAGPAPGPRPARRRTLYSFHARDDGRHRGGHGRRRAGTGRQGAGSGPGLHGCHGEGASIGEALDRIREASACRLASLVPDDPPSPGRTSVITGVEVADAASALPPSGQFATGPRRYDDVEAPPGRFGTGVGRRAVTIPLSFILHQP